MCSRWLAYSSRTDWGFVQGLSAGMRQSHMLFTATMSKATLEYSWAAAQHTHTQILSRLCVLYYKAHAQISQRYTHAQMYDTIWIHRHMQAHNGRHQRENTSKLYTCAKTTGGKHTVTSWGCPNKLHNSSTRSTRFKTTSVPEQHQRASHQTQPASSAALKTLT